jgi:hypothetical protein
MSTPGRLTGKSNKPIIYLTYAKYGSTGNISVVSVDDGQLSPLPYLLMDDTDIHGHIIMVDGVVIADFV